MGILTVDDFEKVSNAPLIALPGVGVTFFKFSFKWSLLVPFVIVSLCGSLKTFGNLITAQKINDAQWKGPDLKNVGNGLFADSLSVISSGLLGGMATDTSASNVGMSLATGATSRVIGFCAGQQGVELQLPDPKRLMWSSAESAVMRVPAKWLMLGATQYLSKFPFGISINNALNKYNNPTNHPHMSRFIRAFPAITNIGGQPYVRTGDNAISLDGLSKGFGLMDRVKSAFVRLKIFKSKDPHIKLADGTKIEIIKQPGRFSKQPMNDGKIKWGENGKTIKFSELTSEQLAALEKSGITFNTRGQLASPTVVYENFPEESQYPVYRPFGFPPSPFLNENVRRCYSTYQNRYP